MMKTRRMRWVGNAARIEEKGSAHRILVGEPEGERPLGSPRRRWRIILKFILEKMECH
jgi:hypothetical protein